MENRTRTGPQTGERSRNLFHDNDDGKTITIKGPSGLKVKAPSIKFVHDEDIPPPPGKYDIAGFKRSTTADKKEFLYRVYTHGTWSCNLCGRRPLLQRHTKHTREKPTSLNLDA